MDRLNDLAERAMVEHLRGEGLNPHVEDGLIYVGLDNLTCRCEVQPKGPEIHPSLNGVVIETFFDNRREDGIHEFVIGIAETPEEGIIKAVHTWVEGIFPAIRGLYEEPDDESRAKKCGLKTADAHTGKVVAWEVYAGPEQIGGAQRDTIYEALQSKPLFALLINAIADARAKGWLAEDRVHWVKIFHARQEDGSLQSECRLDNRDWPEGLAALRQFSWPKSKEMMMFKQFFTLRGVVDVEGAAQSLYDGASAAGNKEQPSGKKWWQVWR